VTIRPAAAGDRERMREVARLAKGHWGYDAELVRSWSAGFAFAEHADRWVAERGEVVAWAALLPPREGVAVLDDLWVEPGAMGAGIGRLLFDVAGERARELGATRLEWGADPNAVGFYEKVGGTFVRDHTTVWGRVAPWMGMDL